MSENNTTRISLETLQGLDSQTDWERLESLSDDEIEAAIEKDPDAELLDADWFQKAQVVNPSVEKKRITIRLDEDIVEYFKKGGAGYQTRINDVLRAFVLSKQWDPRSSPGDVEEGDVVVTVKGRRTPRGSTPPDVRGGGEETPEKGDTTNG